VGTLLLFAGDNYYPVGGWNDFRGQFQSETDALAAVAKGDWDWWHLVDPQTLKIVREGTT